MRHEFLYHVLYSVMFKWGLGGRGKRGVIIGERPQPGKEESVFNHLVTTAGSSSTSSSQIFL